MHTINQGDKACSISAYKPKNSFDVNSISLNYRKQTDIVIYKSIDDSDIGDPTVIKRLSFSSFYYEGGRFFFSKRINTSIAIGANKRLALLVLILLMSVSCLVKLEFL